MLANGRMCAAPHQDCRCGDRRWRARCCRTTPRRLKPPTSRGRWTGDRHRCWVTSPSNCSSRHHGVAALSRASDARPDGMLNSLTGGRCTPVGAHVTMPDAEMHFSQCMLSCLACLTLLSRLHRIRLGGDEVARGGARRPRGAFHNRCAPSGSPQAQSWCRNATSASLATCLFILDLQTASRQHPDTPSAPPPPVGPGLPRRPSALQCNRPSVCPGPEPDHHLLSVDRARSRCRCFGRRAGAARHGRRGRRRPSAVCTSRQVRRLRCSFCTQALHACGVRGASCCDITDRHAGGSGLLQSQLSLSD